MRNFEQEENYCDNYVCIWNNEKKPFCFKNNKWNKQKYPDFKVTECPSRFPEKVRFKVTGRIIKSAEEHL